MKFFADNLDYHSQNGIDTVYFGNEEKGLALTMSSVPGTPDHYLEWNDQSLARYNAVDKISFSHNKLEISLFPEAQSSIGETAFSLNFEADPDTFDKLAECLQTIFGDKLELEKAPGGTTGKAVPPKNYLTFKILDLTGKKLSSLPDYVQEMTALERVWLEGNPNLDLSAALDILCKHPLVKELKISATEHIPDNIGAFTALETLSICGLKAPVTLPASLGLLKSLKYLYVESGSDVTLPEAFAELSALESLNMRVPSWVLPTQFYKLSHLTQLDFTGCRTASIPAEISQMSLLESLIFMAPSPIDFSQAMPHIARIPQLRSLELSLQQVPEELRLCRQIESLIIFGAGTPEAPLVLSDGLFELAQLTELVIGMSCIKEIPEALGKLKSLKVLSIYASEFDSLPDSMGELSELESLNLAENLSLKKLPDTLGKLSKLRSLSVAESPHLTTLPESLGQIKGLEIIQ